MKKILFLTGLLFCLLIFISDARATLSVELYLSPHGGRDPYNSMRTITFSDGRTEAAMLNNAVLDLIERTPRGGAIKIAMYNFNYEPALKALLKKAMTEEVQVKVLLDNCAGWTEENVRDFVASVKSARRNAEKEKRPFDFQVKLVTPVMMRKYGRVRVLEDGKEIVGTMHQKFGIFYEDKNGEPLHVFSGSANLASSSDDIYSENRVFFRNEPAVAKVFANQFARLWNIWSEEASGPITEEKYYEPLPALPFEIIFNGEHTGNLEDRKFRKIDERLLELMEEVKPEGGTLDIAIFSFTHKKMADRLIELAKERPGATFRILCDHSMLTVSEERIGLMPPYMEEKVRELGLKNVEIRYKFRANTYNYNKEKRKVELDHFRSPLLHHKVMIVNREILAFGSYNFSASAEMRNFEDMMIFRADTPYGRDMIERFLKEIDYLWTRTYDENRNFPRKEKPYVISGPYGRELEAKIISVLEGPIPYEIRSMLDREIHMTEKELIRKGKFPEKIFANAIKKMEEALLVEKFDLNGETAYRLAD